MIFLLICYVWSKNFNNYEGNQIIPSAEEVNFNSKAQAKVSTNVLQANYIAGTLVAYIGLGTPAQLMQVLVDTGSSQFWVRSSNCQSATCSGKTMYYPDQSSTFRQGNGSTMLSYGDGTKIACSYSKDMLSIANYSLSQTICTANSIITTTAQTDGIIGFGPPGAQVVPADVGVSLSLSNAWAISFWYNKAQTLNGNGDGGEISIGGPDPDKYSGPITWIPVNRDNTHWTIILTSFLQQGSNILVTSPTNVVVDTGTTFVLISPDLFKKITQGISGFYGRDGVYRVTCSTVQQLKPITVSFGTKVFILAWEQQVILDTRGNQCIYIFQSNSDNSSPTVLGVGFLRYL